MRVKVILYIAGLALAVASFGCSARLDPVYVEALLNEPVEEKSVQSVITASYSVINMRRYCCERLQKESVVL